MSREGEREGGGAQRGGETIDILHARPIEGRRDERAGRRGTRVVTITRRESGEVDGCTVACTCALPPYTTRSYGVFPRVRPTVHDMCARVYTHARTARVRSLLLSLSLSLSLFLSFCLAAKPTPFLERFASVRRRARIQTASERARARG